MDAASMTPVPQTTPGSDPWESAKSRKPSIKVRSPSVGGQETQEAPQRYGRARVAAPWTQHQQQTRSPWATDDDKTTITKISQSKVDGINW